MKKTLFTFKGEQGYSLGRSGMVDVIVTLNEGEVKEVKVDGKRLLRRGNLENIF